MEHRVPGNVSFKIFQLLRIRQFSMDQEVTDLQETGVLRKLFNRIPSVPENSLFTVEKGDTAGAGTSVDIAGIKGDCACLGS